MIQLIIGEKGKGKTKVLLEKANNEIQTAHGNIVYVDKSKQHMYELNRRVRLIDITDYPVKNTDAFEGFLCGLLSQDNDLEQIYLDSFLKIMKLTPEQAGDAIMHLNEISKAFDVDFIISISVVFYLISVRRRGKDKIDAFTWHPLHCL